MKRVFAVLLVIIQLTILCGCKCSHSWQAATCETPSRCSKCGELSSEGKLGHDYGAATCDETGRCTRCGKESTEGKLGHDYSAATCEAPGRCTRCEELSGEMELGHDYSDRTFDAPATCRRCGETTGTALPPVSEWGFNNLADMGNSMVKIAGYSLGKYSDYVTVRQGTYEFQNGYVLQNSFEIIDNQCVFKTAHSPDPYKLVDNNNIIVDGWDWTIYERVTSKFNKNIVVFKLYASNKYGTHEVWCVPYNLIDWERGPELDPDSDPENPKYIMYLKDLY